MYRAKYVSDSGETFYFDFEHDCVADVEGLTGLEVDLSKSQGVNQVGETVGSSTVSGRLITIKGRLLKDATANKRRMFLAFQPMTKGKLYFEDEYYIDCHIKSAPVVEARKFDPKFNLQLFAPFPYWRKSAANAIVIGRYTPAFHFPVCYDKHAYGKKDSVNFVNCYNEGNIKTTFEVELYSEAEVKNPRITNSSTREYILLNTTILPGEKYHLYQSEGRLYVEKTAKGIKTNEFRTLDEGTDFLTLQPGDNVVRLQADTNSNLLVATIKYSDTVVAVYEGI